MGLGKFLRRGDGVTKDDIQDCVKGIKEDIGKKNVNPENPDDVAELRSNVQSFNALLNFIGLTNELDKDEPLEILEHNLPQLPDLINKMRSRIQHEGVNKDCAVALGVVLGLNTVALGVYGDLVPSNPLQDDYFQGMLALEIAVLLILIAIISRGFSNSPSPLSDFSTRESLSLMNDLEEITNQFSYMLAPDTEAANDANKAATA